MAVSDLGIVVVAVGALYKHTASAKSHRRNTLKCAWTFFNRVKLEISDPMIAFFKIVIQRTVNVRGNHFSIHGISEFDQLWK